MLRAMSLKAVSNEVFDNKVVIFGGSETATRIHSLANESIDDDELVIWSKDDDLRSVYKQTESVSLALIDGDDKYLAVLELSHSLEFKDSATQIVILTSEDPTPQMYREIINSNIVHSLSKLDDWEEDFDLKVTTQVANYFVLKMLQEDMIQDVDNENSLRSYNNEFVGFIMTNYSLVKYAIIEDIGIRENEILIGSYLGSVLDMIRATDVNEMSNYNFKLGNVEILAKQDEEKGYFFLFKDLSSRYRKIISSQLEEIISTMEQSVGDHFTDPNLIGDTDIQAVELVLNNYNLNFDRTVSRLDNPKIILYKGSDKIENILTDHKNIFEFKRIYDFEDLVLQSNQYNPQIYVITLVKQFEEMIREFINLVTMQNPSLQVIYLLQDDAPSYLKTFFDTQYNVHVILPNDKLRVLEDAIMNTSSNVITNKFTTLEVVPKLPGMNLKSYLSMAYKNRLQETYDESSTPELVAVRFMHDRKLVYEKNKYPELDVFKSMEVEQLTQSLKEFGQQISNFQNIYSMKINNMTILFLEYFTFDFVFVINNLRIYDIEKIGVIINEYTFELTSLLVTEEVNSSENRDFTIENYLEDLAVKIASST